MLTYWKTAAAASRIEMSVIDVGISCHDFGRLKADAIADLSLLLISCGLKMLACELQSSSAAVSLRPRYLLRRFIASRIRIKYFPAGAQEIFLSDRELWLVISRKAIRREASAKPRPLLTHINERYLRFTKLQLPGRAPHGHININHISLISHFHNESNMACQWY